MYLKPNVIAEPLFNQWYAWSYLIPPATAAKYVAKSHLQIMESFVAAPKVHWETLKNPAMIGGPFINYDPSRAWEIELLLSKTKTEQQQLLALDKAIAELDNILQAQAAGYSLEPLYCHIPEILQGYVELIYNRYNQPEIRLIEGLLYQSRFYNPNSQSVLLYLNNPDTRSFVLSTPRLANDHSLLINLPFKDAKWDNLFKMREIPQEYSDIKAALAINDSDDTLFAEFFTSQPPEKKPKYDGDEVRIRYFGHACVLIETKDVSILCDPVIPYENKGGIPRYSYEDLPEKIDYALITHNHQDHVMFESLLQIRYKIEHLIVPKSNKGSLVDPSLKLILKQIGFTDVRELDELETIAIADGLLISLPVLGEHGDLNIAAKSAYLIQIKGKSILCAADSNNIEPQLYQNIYNYLGNINVMFIGMECDGAPFTWAYGALMGSSISRKMAETRRLDGSNAQKAIALVKQFDPQQVYVYAMGQEPWLTYITSIQYTEDSRPILESNRLVEYCLDNNIVSERLFGRAEIVLSKSSQNLNKITKSPNSEITSLDKERVITEGWSKVLHCETSDSASTSLILPPEAQDTLSSTKRFMFQLEKLDIKLSLDGKELCINAPKGRLTSNLVAELKKRKPEIIALLKS